jgi:hypothetical protein
MATKRQVINHGNVRWEVDFGVDVMGKKKRLFFGSETRADGIGLQPRRLKTLPFGGLAGSQFGCSETADDSSDAISTTLVLI